MKTRAGPASPGAVFRIGRATAFSRATFSRNYVAQFPSFRLYLLPRRRKMILYFAGEFTSWHVPAARRQRYLTSVYEIWPYQIFFGWTTSYKTARVRTFGLPADACRDCSHQGHDIFIERWRFRGRRFICFLGGKNILVSLRISRVD